MKSSTKTSRELRLGALLSALSLAIPVLAQAQTGESFQLYVSNERSDDVTVINAADLQPAATIPVGKRPRGIHASVDGKLVYVALSGTPIAVPKIDAQGNPVFQRGKDDDDDESSHADKTADGIGVIDVAQHKLTNKLLVGSDPEEFALSKSGAELYISNEDVKTASVISLSNGKVEHIIPIAQEPEGVATSPDGKAFYVTCEAGGEVFVVDTANFKVVGHFSVPPRPRSMAFLLDSAIGFIPSESTGQLNVIDTANYKVLKTIALPQGSRPMSVKVSVDGKKIYVSNGRAGTVSVLDSHSYELLDSIKVGTRPWGLVISPDGKYLYTANGPSNDISVVDLRTDKETARIKAGGSPWGIAIVGR
jgi:YVTN family beta-propeller protein